MDDGNYFQSNQFICPKTGTYFFSLNLKKYSTHQIQLDLVYGNKTVFRLEDTQSANANIALSNSALVRCLHGICQLTTFIN